MAGTHKFSIHFLIFYFFTQIEISHCGLVGNTSALEYRGPSFSRKICSDSNDHIEIQSLHLVLLPVAS